MTENVYPNEGKFDLAYLNLSTLNNLKVKNNVRFVPNNDFYRNHV